MTQETKAGRDWTAGYTAGAASSGARIARLEADLSEQRRMTKDACQSLQEEEERCATLEAALRPFANMGRAINESDARTSSRTRDVDKAMVPIGHLRAALRALNDKGDTE